MIEEERGGERLGQRRRQERGEEMGRYDDRGGEKRR